MLCTFWYIYTTTFTRYQRTRARALRDSVRAFSSNNLIDSVTQQCGMPVATSQHGFITTLYRISGSYISLTILRFVWLLQLGVCVVARLLAFLESHEIDTRSLRQATRTKPIMPTTASHFKTTANTSVNSKLVQSGIVVYHMRSYCAGSSIRY
jgi:hypothetical protein